MKTRVGLLATVLLVSGCVTPLSDADRTPAISKAPQGSLSVGVLDRREKIVLGGKKDTWEGLGHGVYGIPYYHHTRSKLPVATYLAQMIARGFEARNARVTVIKLPPAGPPDAAKAKVTSAGTNRALLVVLKNWYVDYGNTSIELFYDADVTVFDAQGRSVAFKNFEGSEVTEFGLMTSYYDQIEKAHKKRLQAILADYTIAAPL